MKTISFNIFIMLLFLGFVSRISGQTVFHHSIQYKNADDSIQEKYNQLDIFQPVNKRKPAAVIFIHGGGLYTGARYIPEIFRKNNFIVIAPGYRLYPFTKCPGYIEDAASAVAWTYKNIKKFGGNPKNIFVTGYSAGAYLASMLMLDKSYLAKHNIDPDSLGGFYLFSGQMTTHTTVQLERGDTVNSSTELVDVFAPLYHIRKVKVPVTFFTGARDKDMLGRYKQNNKITEKLNEAGSESVEFIELQGKDHAGLLDTAMMIASDKINAIMILQERTDVLADDLEYEIKDDMLYFYGTTKPNKLVITDLRGSVLIEKKDAELINLSALVSGVYLMSFKTDTLKFQKKILINK
jgi:acetyl esterase/lipase